MAKYFILIVLLISPSFGYYYYDKQPVDSCGIINLVNHKQELSQVMKELQQYPDLFNRVNVVLADIMFQLWDKPKAYKKVINAIVNYSYNHNVCKWTKTYLVLSYIAYVLYDKYLALTSKPNWVERLLQILNVK